MESTARSGNLFNPYKKTPLTKRRLVPHAWIRLDAFLVQYIRRSLSSLEETKNQQLLTINKMANSISTLRLIHL